MCGPSCNAREATVGWKEESATPPFAVTPKGTKVSVGAAGTAFAGAAAFVAAGGAAALGADFVSTSILVRRNKVCMLREGVA